MKKHRNRRLLALLLALAMLFGTLSTTSYATAGGVDIKAESETSLESSTGEETTEITTEEDASGETAETESTTESVADETTEAGRAGESDETGAAGTEESGMAGTGESGTAGTEESDTAGETEIAPESTEAEEESVPGAEISSELGTDAVAATDESGDEESPAGELTAEEQAEVDEVIARIDALPTLDEIYEKLDAYDEAEDYDGYDEYLTEVQLAVSEVYAAYCALTETQQAAVTGADKLLELTEVLGLTGTAAVDEEASIPTSIQIDDTHTLYPGSMTTSSGSEVWTAYDAASSTAANVKVTVTLPSGVSASSKKITISTLRRLEKMMPTTRITTP